MRIGLITVGPQSATNGNVPGVFSDSCVAKERHVLPGAIVLSGDECLVSMQDSVMKAKSTTTSSSLGRNASRRSNKVGDMLEQDKVEIHWYEAHGIGRRDLKIKRYLEES
jgi:hypothetical protein